MYLYEEHVRDDTVKEHLKQMYANVVERSGQTVEMTQSNQEGPASTGDRESKAATTDRNPSEEICHIAQSLIQAVDEEVQEPEYSAAEMSSVALQYSPITIKELLDYSHTEAWLDADGIDDPDCSQAEEMSAV
ncbi:hypothetical protein BS17DRAFT_765282 [Gyrodon lividus]|nr:hypothetical protein BS17DRAFT_765282 [Gyrodon lividus]